MSELGTIRQRDGGQSLWGFKFIGAKRYFPCRKVIQPGPRKLIGSQIAWLVFFCSMLAENRSKNASKHFQRNFEDFKRGLQKNTGPNIVLRKWIFISLRDLWSFRVMRSGYFSAAFNLSKKQQD